MGRFFVARPVMAIVIAILIILIGGSIIPGLPIAQYPNIVPPEILVQATYPGADALTVEGAVAAPQPSGSAVPTPSPSAAPSPK